MSKDCYYSVIPQISVKNTYFMLVRKLKIFRKFCQENSVYPFAAVTSTYQHYSEKVRKVFQDIGYEFDAIHLVESSHELIKMQKL